MKSQLRGVEVFKQRLRKTVDAAAFEMAEANRDNALTLQRHVVPRVPVDTGATRDAFADPEAVGLSRDAEKQGGWRFGLITEALRARGYKAHWLEYGTKGYAAGDTRSYDAVSAKGQAFRKRRKVRRNVPARPARPFFRPGVEAARAQMIARWALAVRRAVKLEGRPISSRQLEDA